MDVVVVVEVLDVVGTISILLAAIEDQFAVSGKVVISQSVPVFEKAPIAVLFAMLIATLDKLLASSDIHPLLEGRFVPEYHANPSYEYAYAPLTVFCVAT